MTIKINVRIKIMKIRILIIGLIMAAAPLFGMELPEDSKSPLKIENFSDTKAKLIANQVFLSIPNNIQTVHDMANALCEIFQNADIKTLQRSVGKQLISIIDPY